jgi:hypothetical protein
MTRSLCILIGLSSLALIACGGASSEKKEGTTVASRPDYCPEPGTFVPLGRLISEPKKFKRCDITTEAALMGVHSMDNWMMASFKEKGRTLFQLNPPGQAAQPYGLFASLVSVSDADANALFSAPSGTVIKLRGEFKYKSQMMGMDIGGQNRCFHASTLTVGATAAATTPAPAQ